MVFAVICGLFIHSCIQGCNEVLMSNELIQLYEAIAELGENESLEPEIKTSTETNEKKEIVSSSILQPEIHNSMETDRYYYQTGVDAYKRRL
jgi:hypothetical protein